VWEGEGNGGAGVYLALDVNLAAVPKHGGFHYRQA
jgi:hypothetical protein